MTLAQIPYHGLPARENTPKMGVVRFSQWKKPSDSSLMIYDQKEALRVEIAVTGAGFEIRPETIQEDLGIGRKPTRLGINLTQPVTGAMISLTISPIE